MTTSSLGGPIATLARTLNRHYKPLNDMNADIRLLRFSWDETTGCAIETPTQTWSLQEVALAQAPPYLAISHVWGVTTDRIEIELQEMTLTIPPALCNALKAINAQLAQGDERLPKVQHVWADAISIDQSCDAEKTTQVAKMSEIYNKAQTTVAWLGTPGSDLESIFTAVNSVAEELAMSDRDDGQHQQRSKRVLLEFLKKHSTDPGLETLLDHPFWTRIWILQETVAPKDILYVCGHSADALLPWQSLFNVLSIDCWPLRQGETLESQFQHIDLARWARLGIPARRMLQERIAMSGPGGKRSLALLLRKTRSCFYATDARDLVYALMSFSADRPLLPDYSRDYASVCQQAALYLLDSCGPSKVLQEAERRPWFVPDPERLFNGASWIPDWQGSTWEVSDYLPLMGPPHTLSPAVWANILGDEICGEALKENAIYLGEFSPGRYKDWLKFRRHAFYQSNSSHKLRSEDVIVGFEDKLDKRAFAILRPDGAGYYWFLHMLKPSGKWQNENSCLLSHLTIRSFHCDDAACKWAGIFGKTWQTVQLR